MATTSGALVRAIPTAQSCAFTPTADRQAVDILRFQIQSIGPAPGGWRALVSSGNVGMSAFIPAAFAHWHEPPKGGDQLIAEQPRGGFLIAPYSALYPAHLALSHSSNPSRKPQGGTAMTQATSLDLPITMIEAAPATAPLTMSSLEIAAVVGSRHDKTKQSIERLAERGVITLPPLGEVSNPGPGPKTIEVYRVGKRDSYVIVAQLSPEFTAQLVDRWQQLEDQAAGKIAIPQTLPDALRLAADLAEGKNKAEAALALAAPKVEGFERLINASGRICIRDSATQLKVRERKLVLYGLQKRWWYRRAGHGGLIGFAERIRDGLLEHKVRTIHNEQTGEDEVREQVYITPRGLAVLERHVSEIEAA